MSDYRRKDRTPMNSVRARIIDLLGNQAAQGKLSTDRGLPVATIHRPVVKSRTNAAGCTPEGFFAVMLELCRERIVVPSHNEMSFGDLHDALRPDYPCLDLGEPGGRHYKIKTGPNFAAEIDEFRARTGKYHGV